MKMRGFAEASWGKVRLVLTMWLCRAPGQDAAEGCPAALTAAFVALSLGLPVGCGGDPASEAEQIPVPPDIPGFEYPAGEPADIRQAKQTQRLRVSAWMLGNEESFRSFVENVDVLTEVSPVWFKPGDNGEVLNRDRTGIDPPPEAREAEVRAICRAYGILLLPLINNYFDVGFNRDIVSQMLNDPERRAKHLQELVDVVMKRDYDGFEIDYESILTADREAFTQFVADLAAELHRRGKKLAIAVHAKLNEPGADWGGYGPRGQDYVALGQVVDFLRPMTYDYHWGTGSVPGPVAPLSWYNSVLEFAKTVVPVEKIQAGINTYGYDWIVGTTQAETFPARMVAELGQTYSFTVQFDAMHNESNFKYMRDAIEREVWFGDATSLALKLNKVHEASLAGISIWRLGFEEPAFWQTLRADIAAR